MTVGKWPTWPPSFLYNNQYILFPNLNIVFSRTSLGRSEYHRPVRLCQQVKKVEWVQRDDQVPQLLGSWQRQVSQLLRQLYISGSGQCRLPQLLASRQHSGNWWISSGQKRWLWSPGHHDLGPQWEYLHDWTRILQSWFQFWTVWLWTQQSNSLEQCEGCRDLQTQRRTSGSKIQAALLGREYESSQNCLWCMEEGGSFGKQKGGNCKQRKRRRDCKMQFSSERGRVSYFIRVCLVEPISK